MFGLFSNSTPHNKCGGQTRATLHEGMRNGTLGWNMEGGGVMAREPFSASDPLSGFVESSPFQILYSRPSFVVFQPAKKTVLLSPKKASSSCTQKPSHKVLQDGEGPTAPLPPPPLLWDPPSLEAHMRAHREHPGRGLHGSIFPCQQRGRQEQSGAAIVGHEKMFVVRTKGFTTV